MDGFYYGAVSVICLYELVVFKGYREKSQLYFVAMFIAISALIASIQTLTTYRGVPPPGSPVIPLYTLLMGLTFLTTTQFPRHAFAVKTANPLLDRLLVVLLYIDVVWTAVCLFQHFAGRSSPLFLGVSGAGLGALHTSSLVWMFLTVRKINLTSFRLYLAGTCVLGIGVWARVSVSYIPALNTPFFLSAMHLGVLGNAFFSMLILRNKISALEDERRMQKDKLMQADKLSSLGIMASSVVHDISNPNSAVANDAAFLRSELPAVFVALDDYVPDSEKIGCADKADAKARLIRAIEGIEAGSKRIASIVGDLRSFYKNSYETRIEPVEVRVLFDTTFGLLEGEITRRKVRVRRQDPGAGLYVRGNSGRLEQVLVNLLMNSFHAVAGCREAEIRIDVSAEEKHIGIRIADNGCGMEKEQLKKAGTVFFTTKKDQGTGLGLYICRKILSECEGSLDLTSAPGRGTCATVMLVRTEAPATDAGNGGRGNET